MSSVHSFHIPVMGIGYSIDTPLRVAHLGIDSVVSLVDDILLEKLRQAYCKKYQLDYKEINSNDIDHRAQRIRSYLNMIKELAEEKFQQMKSSGNSEFEKYIQMLPEKSSIREKIRSMNMNMPDVHSIREWLSEHLHMGSIDVNIMTKVDKANFHKNEKLPVEYNDAHAALRGFATSNLHGSLVLSAGLNPALYAYMEKFDDFYPNKEGQFKKKIILKVSDYRSALIQGKYLAKKGLWISEYRIESGLNCGGHAFATDGYLMGPILAEFRDKRQELRETLWQLFSNALKNKAKTAPETSPNMRITAQGGVGTSEEHQFLLEHYQLDSVGWGTPFLLVPEVTNVDQDTLDKLISAKEDDLYLSGISPLGVPFNSLRGNTKDIEKQRNIDKGRPGSACPKRYVALNNDYNEQGLCTASRQFQHIKINELNDKNLNPEQYKKEFDAIVEKSCVCVGLGTSALIRHDINTKVEGNGISICPGPNMAYFDQELSLAEMVDHIYGRKNVIRRNDRPNLFVKELNLYLMFLRNKYDEILDNFSDKQEKYLTEFTKNLEDGIHYYQELFAGIKNYFHDSHEKMMTDLEKSKVEFERLKEKVLQREPIHSESL